MWDRSAGAVQTCLPHLILDGAASIKRDSTGQRTRSLSSVNRCKTDLRQLRCDTCQGAGRLSDPEHTDQAAERVLGLGRVAVQRSWFPVMRSPDSTRQGSGQCLGRLPGTAHGELDLLVDLAGQAPRLILRPHQVRLLRHPCCRPVPSQSRCVSERFDRAGEQHHRSIRNLHSRRLRRQCPARPALPYGRIPRGRRGRV